MRTILGLAGCAAALVAGACSGDRSQVSKTIDDGPAVQVAGRLDCPQREGDLRLQSAAADGRSCAYRGEDGTEVELRLAAADTLPALEAELKALIPAADLPAEPPRPPEAMDSGNHVGVADNGDRTEVRLPGMKIDAQGDRASIRMLGVTINAEGDNADVRVGGDDGESVSVRANDGAAQIRVADKGKAGQHHSTFLVTSDEPGPSGWRLAGYQTRGPSEGTLVLGVVRARNDRHRGLMDDVDDLLQRNVGG